MTTTTWTAAPTNTSDATFRAWGSALSAALAAVGLVKTADTGQINWTTILAPTGVNTLQGYEIWRFNDSLQSTAPLFIKLEYGSATAATTPNLRWTLGKSSDGAGTLTGTIGTALLLPAPSGSTTAFTWYMSSGDGSMLCFAPAPAFYSAGYWSYVLERSRSTSGAATGVGLHVSYQNTSLSIGYRAYNYAAATGIAANNWPVAPPSYTSDGVAGGGKAALFPAILTDGLGNWWQPRSVLVGLVNDIGNMSTFDVPGWGTYLPITGMLSYDAPGDPSSRAAIAWY